MTLTVTGVDEVARMTDRLAVVLEDGLPVDEQLADAVRVPVLTGAAAATLTVVATTTGVAVQIGGPSAPYAPYVHLEVDVDAATRLSVTALVDHLTQAAQGA